jgi:hypothetical protein
MASKQKTMSEAFEKIERSMDAFGKSVEHFAETLEPHAMKNAYDSFYRVRDRYTWHAKSENRHLDAGEFEALRNVFEDDFIKGMGRLRNILTHVETGDVELYYPHGPKFTLTAASSAEVVGASTNVTVSDKAGNGQRIEHLKWLEEAIRRIDKAISKARGS